jgi:putative transcriptional regulator
MIAVSFARCAAAATSMVLLAALASAAQPAPEAPPPHASLAGQLLVATPSIGDPRFHQAVILMVRHDQTGAFGLVVNRPLGERPLASLLAALGDRETAAEGNVRIFAGGPVQPEVGFVLHSAEYRRPDTMQIDGRVAVTSSREILRDMAARQGPKQTLIAFGYAGWGAGQLDGELEKRVWFTAPADGKLLFEQDREKVWDDAMTHRTEDL